MTTCWYCLQYMEGSKSEARLAAVHAFMREASRLARLPLLRIIVSPSAAQVG